MSTVSTGRSKVEDILGREMTREIWSGNYDKVLPISIQDFDLSAILPAVFYMFRFGQRRGKGKFFETFGVGKGTATERRRSITIEKVAGRLSEHPTFDGFGEEVEQAILADLLLCYCLENKKKALGRNEPVQRVAPAHYMSSWVDLPERVVNLRKVPEMMVAMLANQTGEGVRQTKEGEKTWFAVGSGFEKNLLLTAFHQGISASGEFLANRPSDHFNEKTPVGIDQLLMIRLAQQLGAAPDKLRGESASISNQRPIAERAAQHFSEDIRRFVRSYAEVIPRHALVSMLESCMTVGLFTLLTSVVELLFQWAETGDVCKPSDQGPAYFFVDCSNGVNQKMRALSEQSFDDFMRRTERFPVLLMALRLLDWGARYNRKIKQLKIPTKPYATEWLNLLGDILHQRHEESDPIHYDFDQKAAALAEKLQEEYPEVAEVLENSKANPNSVWRFAESLTLLMGGKTQQKFVTCLDSALLLGCPNGLATKRRVKQAGLSSGKKTRDLRSLIFSDSVLEYLVHLHLLPSGHRSGLRALSFKNFIDILRERHGFCVDEAPPGMMISNDLLQTNRAILERRLRDLGLLSGVNDAEAMKRLTPRFTPAAEARHES